MPAGSTMPSFGRKTIAHRYRPIFIQIISTAGKFDQAVKWPVEYRHDNRALSQNCLELRS
jgi:hypothetical protein